MKYNQLMKEYYSNVNNLTQLLRSMVDSYRLLIAGAAELNNINEARTSYVKDAVHRADKLGETIDHLIELIDDCGESYFHYCAVIGDYKMRNRIRSVEKGRLGTKHRSESGTAHSIMNKKGVSNANAT